MMRNDPRALARQLYVMALHFAREADQLERSARVSAASEHAPSQARHLTMPRESAYCSFASTAAIGHHTETAQSAISFGHRSPCRAAKPELAVSFGNRRFAFEGWPR